MKKRSLVLFPGFMGQPSDWDAARALLPKQFLEETKIIAMDFFSLQSQLSPASSWKEINDFIDNEVEGTYIHFLGYSMGGRLALKLNAERVDKVNTITLLSAHPGISGLHYNEGDIEGLILERKNWDNLWAHRFLKEKPLEKVFESWSELSIFDNDSKIERDVFLYNKDKLALGLKKWSPAEIIISEVQLANHNWVCGEKDEKYLELYKKIEKRTKGKFTYLEDVGHRTIFSSDMWINFFLKEISANES